jgi:hypothetical protein
MTGCALSKGGSLCYQQKKILFPSSFWGIFVFLSFSIILESLKKNERMIHYKGGTCFIDILVPSTRNTLILKARGHMQEKDTREKSSMGQGVKTQRQSATRLAYNTCLRWFS